MTLGNPMRTRDRHATPPIAFADPDVHEYVADLYATGHYEMRDIANSLIGAWSGGQIDFGAVDAIFVAEGWPWPGDEGRAA